MGFEIGDKVFSFFWNEIQEDPGRDQLRLGRETGRGASWAKIFSVCTNMWLGVVPS